MVVGEHQVCAVCGSSRFGEHAGRPHALCLECGSLERHRALALALDGELRPRGGARALECAPRSPFLWGDWLRGRGWRYEAIDLWRTRAPHDPESFAVVDHAGNLDDLGRFPTASFELFITQHVIEVIPDYRGALEEIARVLEPGGRALMEIPWRPDETTHRLPPGAAYGNFWSFGGDLLDTVRARFDSVEVVEQQADGYRGHVFVCRRA